MKSIGIFDSGVGGLTVLKALRRILPNEDFVYLGDTARLPYGSKSPATIRKYLIQNISFMKQFDVKAIVVACNSASTVVHEVIWDTIPIYDVIRPGARAAFEQTRSQRIGILGTKATIQSEAYIKALTALDTDLWIIQQACPLLVPLVEEGWEADPVTESILHRYLDPVLERGVDTLILGCTHYPVLKSSIARVAGPDIGLIDSAEVLARQLQHDIASGHIPRGCGSGQLTVWATDLAESFAEVGRRIMAPFETQHWKLADIQPDVAS